MYNILELRQVSESFQTLCVCVCVCETLVNIMLQEFVWNNLQRLVVNMLKPVWILASEAQHRGTRFYRKTGKVD